MTLNIPIYLSFYYAIRGITICRSAKYAGQGKCALLKIYCDSALSENFVIKSLKSCGQIIGLCLNQVSNIFLWIFYNIRVFQSNTMRKIGYF